MNMTEKLAVPMSTDQNFLNYFEGLKHRINTYHLLVNDAAMKYIIPCSGGADSTALAILMHALFPSTDFELLFTDTKAEEPEIYESLNRLEIYLGKKITRVIPENGLFEMIDKYKGFLPSAMDRWCTRQLKLTGFKSWLTQYDGIPKQMFVGIRSDESERLAFTIDEVETEMPFVDMGLKREDIFGILSHSIGIPKFYKRRTRSGCSTCFFQRRSELVGLYQEQPIEFHRGRKYEKLSLYDIHRHAEAMPLWKDSGIAPNWQSLPLPTRDAVIKGSRPKISTLDIFGNRGIFMAGEFFMDGMLSSDEFVWHQRVISYSPTLAGIRGQIDDRYRHLLETAEVFDMTPEEVKQKAKFAIWYVELPEGTFDPDGPTKGSFTWQSKSSYAQLQHIISWCTRALHVEGLRQVAGMKVKSELSVQYEWAQSASQALEQLSEPAGQVSLSQWYEPTHIAPVQSAEEEMLNVACPMCSI